MLRTSALILSLALSATTASASTWIADNGLVVRDTGNGTFSIPYRGRSETRAFWCAAGDFVISELNLSRNTRIYRTSPPPRGSGEGVAFSLSPEGATATGLAVIGSPKGLRAGFAKHMCSRLFRVGNFN